MITSFEQLGKVAYEAYCAQLILTFVRPPAWEQLSQPTRAGWVTAAQAVVQQIQSIH